MEKNVKAFTKRYSQAVDDVCRLNEVLKHSKSCHDLFQSEVSSVRLRLKESCEKLIFCQSSAISNKAEEYLWRKVYYEVINFVKRHKNQWDCYTQAAVKRHLASGIGTYHTLIRKIHLHYENEFQNEIYPHIDDRISKFMFKFQIALGDLTRYQADFSDIELRKVSESYYREAITLNPESCHPYNQLGTLNMPFNYGLDTVYYYFQGLLTHLQTEMTKTNLIHLLEKNRKVYAEDALNSFPSNKTSKVKKFILCFLRLVDIFYSNTESDSGLSDLCQDLLQDLPECLPVHKDLLKNTKLEIYPTCISPDMAFKIVVILESCFLKLQEQESVLTSASVAFLFAFMSQIVLYSISACNSILPQLIQQSVSESNYVASFPDNKSCNTSESKKDRPKGGRSLRRRRRENGGESESSEGEEFDSICSSMDSDIELSHSTSEDDESEVLSESGKTQDSNEHFDSTAARLDASAELALQVVELALDETSPKKCLPTNNGDDSLNQSSDQGLTEHNMDILKILSTNGFLLVVKNFCDWLRSSPEFLKNCAMSSNLLWSRIVTLSNTLLDTKIFLEDKIRGEVLPAASSFDQYIQLFPLPEDKLMLYFPGWEGLTNEFDQNFKLTHLEQIAIRIQTIHLFSNLLVQSYPEIGITYDESTFKFNTPNAVDEESIKNPCWLDQENKNENESKNKKEMMQNMTHLWLKAEVNDLEQKVQVNSSKSFSPYLVPHSSVLVHHLPSVRRLTLTKKFIVFVPKTVLETLDSMKKTSMNAREASRWLEAELKRGNRFLRAQRQHEKLCLSPIKYPKRKDKQLWDAYQILECCNYLCNQTFSSNQKMDEKLSYVTMLVSKFHGDDDEFEAESIKGLASSIGVNIEDIDGFCSQLFKSNRKRSKK